MDIYFHRNPKTFEVFYVGRGVGKRSKKFDSRNKSWFKYVVENGNPVVQIVHTNLQSDECCFWERYYIALFGKIQNGGQLVNMADGGETNAGTKYSSEQKEIYRAIAKSRDNSHLLTKEARSKVAAKLSERYKGALLGESNPNYGHRWTEEMKVNLSKKRKAQSGRKIICTNTGTIFDSIVDAAKHLNMGVANMSYKLHGKHKNNTGLKFLT